MCTSSKNGSSFQFKIIRSRKINRDEGQITDSQEMQL